MTRCEGDGDPFGSSPLYSSVFTQPDPFQLPRFADGRLADFGRSAHWLINSIWSGSSSSTDQQQRERLRHRQVQKRRLYAHVRARRRIGDAPQQQSGTAVRSFLHSPSWGTLALAGPLPIPSTAGISPLQTLLAATHAHLSSTPRGNSTLHIHKELQTLSVSMVHALHQAPQCSVAAVLQGDVHMQDLHNAQPKPSGGIVVDCKNRGHGFLHVAHAQGNNVNVWTRGVVTLGTVRAGVDMHFDDAARMSDLNARVVYAGTRRDPRTGQPESYQVALSSYHFGQEAELSLFHHTAVRVNALPHCYWRNTSYGLLLTYSNRLARPWQVHVASSWQLDGTSLIQGAISDQGTFDLSLKMRPYHFNDAAADYLPDLVLGATMSCNVVTSKLEFSASLCFGNWRQWRKLQTFASV